MDYYIIEEEKHNLIENWESILGESIRIQISKIPILFSIPIKEYITSINQKVKEIFFVRF